MYACAINHQHPTASQTPVGAANEPIMVNALDPWAPVPSWLVAVSRAAAIRPTTLLASVARSACRATTVTHCARSERAVTRAARRTPSHAMWRRISVYVLSIGLVPHAQSVPLATVAPNAPRQVRRTTHLAGLPFSRPLHSLLARLWA